MLTAHDLVYQAKQKITEISLSELDEAIRAADVLIDVREADEYQVGHLPGALHIPRGLLEFKLSSVDSLNSRDLRIVLYCKSSGRAALAALTLQQMGYLQVQSIAGGFDAYRAAGRVVVKPSLPSFE